MRQLTEAEINALEALWSDALDPGSRDDLLQRLKDEPDFERAATAWKRVITAGFEWTQAEKETGRRIKDQLQKLEQELPPIMVTPARNIGLRRWYYPLAGAAAVLLLLFLAYQAWFSGQQDDLQAFFRHPTRSEANLGDERSPGETAYDKRQYGAARTLLIREAAQKQDSLLLFYAGVAALGDNDPAAAVTLLESAVAAESLSLYTDTFKWYLAQAYARSGKPEQARLLLKELSTTGGPYEQEAKALSSALDQEKQ